MSAGNRTRSSTSGKSKFAHEFSVGQMITLLPHATLGRPSGARYEILAVLPWRDGEPQYKIRSIDEPYDRVVAQHHIATAAP